MPEQLTIPDLTFPSVVYGQRETPWDLRVLLYRGAAMAYAKTVSARISTGMFGAPLLERLELVVQMHSVIKGRLTGGASAATARNNVRGLRSFFGWAEGSEHQLTLECVEQTFLGWTDALLHRIRVARDLKERSAYSMATWVGEIIDVALDRRTPIVQLTRLNSPRLRKAARASAAEKEDLKCLFIFGQLLQDICDGLSLHCVLRAPLPVKIPLRSGGQIEAWAGYSAGGSARKRSEALLARERDGTLRTRSPLANLRIEAELLMFIGQTSMNFAQAHQLRVRQFCYVSHLDGYQVKDRKNRRGGEVLFEIFKEYKPHFERYLAWRRELFQDSDFLFPFVRAGRAEHMHPQFGLRSICKRIGVQFVPPLTLRSARVNWLLRRSGDADLTAELAQHTKQTLLSVYERPSQQRAMSEVMRFWCKHDPEIASISVAPGQCGGQPAPVAKIPPGAPRPDCLLPSGCMWCEYHRDVDSSDYIWALASFRHLKLIEQSKWPAPPGTKEIHPAGFAVERISEKLRWFSKSNAKRKAWVDEGLARIEEGSYHPQWKILIDSVEGGA